MSTESQANVVTSSFGRFDPRNLDLGSPKPAKPRKKHIAQSLKRQPDRHGKHGGPRH